MRHLLAAAFLFLSTVGGWAQWALSSRETLPASPGLQFAEVKVTNADGRKSEIHTVVFRTKSHSLVVIDNPSGDGDLASKAQARGALAAVNGAYFHPDRTPLGLVVSGGKTIHAQERAKLLSGVLVSSGDSVALRRVNEFKMTPKVKEALQGGPFLVDGGKPVSGLNSTRSAARTAVCTLSDGRIAILTCRSATLAETAQILLTPGLLPEGGKIVRALNLDGGSSTGLWVKNPTGDHFYSREFKDVRNYVAIVPRAK